MQNVLQWFVLFLSDCVQLAAQGILIFLIFNKKVEWRKLVVFAPAASLATGLPAILLPGYNLLFNIVIYIVVMTFLLKFILGFKFLHGIVATFTLLLMATVIQYMGLLLLKVSLQDKFIITEWGKVFILKTIARNIGTLPLIVIILIIFYLKMKINMPGDVGRKRWLGIIVNCVITYILVVPNILFFENTAVKIPFEVIIFNAVSVAILLMLSIYNSIRFGELEFKRQEVEFQKLYIQTLNDLIDGLRGFKHDFNNVVQVVGGYLALNDMEGLKKYHRQMEGEARKINNIIPLNSYVKDNPAIYGLLLSKISYSEMRYITFNITILSDICTGNFKIYDFCKIIGIFLDNAFEAAAESKEKYVDLCIKEGTGNTLLVVDISNSFLGEVDVEKMFNYSYTTKHDHQGFGLWEVKKILARYKNCTLDTIVNSNILTQRLEIQYQL